MCSLLLRHGEHAAGRQAPLFLFELVPLGTWQFRPSGGWRLEWPVTVV
jgi:hypothetical protein